MCARIERVWRESFRVSFGGRRERGERGVATQYRLDKSVIGSIRRCRGGNDWALLEFCDILFLYKFVFLFYYDYVLL